MTVQQAKMLDLASTWKAKSVLVRFCFHPERDPTRGQWSICVGANDDSHITYWDESDVADPERLERNTANTVAAWRQQEGNNPPLRMVCAVCAREIEVQGELLEVTFAATCRCGQALRLAMPGPFG